MEARSQILAIAYQYLQEKKKSSFQEIWKHVKTKITVTEQDEERLVGNLYTGMVLDTHFFLKSDKLWYPRSEVTLDEIKYQISSIIEEQNQKDEFDLADETEILENDDDLDSDSISIVEDSYDDGDIEKINNSKKEILEQIDYDEID